MGFRLLASWVFVLSFASGSAWAWPPTLGFELTFTNPACYRAKYGDEDWGVAAKPNKQARNAFGARLESMAAARRDFTVTRGTDKYGYKTFIATYRDRFRFEVTLDTYVVEVPMMSTLPQLERHETRIQKDIFDVATSVGLEATWIWGGGHVHVGADSTFGDNVLFFRNWIADQANGVWLATGAMEYDDANAMSLWKLKPELKTTLARILADADRGAFRTPRDLASEVLAHVLMGGRKSGKAIMAAKYWQMNLNRFARFPIDIEPDEDGEWRTWDDWEAYFTYGEVKKAQRTIQQRAVRTMLTARDVLLEARVLHGRLDYVRRMTKPLPLSPLFFAKRLPSVAERARMFRGWVEEAASVLPKESKVDIEEYGERRLYPGPWREAFLGRETPAKCSRKMAGEARRP